jgi:hypothetical protein
MVIKLLSNSIIKAISEYKLHWVTDSYGSEIRVWTNWYDVKKVQTKSHPLIRP